VRIYNGSRRQPMTSFEPEDYAENVRWMTTLDEGFTIVKQGIAFHSPMKREIPDFFYGEVQHSTFHGWMDRGPLTEKGLKHIVTCVAAMKEVLGDRVALALDCGPGWMLSDAIRFAKAVEEFNLLWLEDMITGDYIPYVNADVYREVTRSTNHAHPHRRADLSAAELQRAHRAEGGARGGPDPCDCGGIAELKWIAEYADLHGILMAPHGTGNGVLGMAALVQVCATMPANFIAFEYPTGDPAWWYDIVDGLPNPLVKDGHIEVWDRPGMGVDLNPERARQYLLEEDKAFFD
jgi:L-alanine-DL-glutamate epimerase-like enolase superfamily enzyme